MNEYVLRNREARELDRLAFQHDVWRVETDSLLDRAGIGDGCHVTDLGCGPGFLSIDLARRVGARGKVNALDASELFIAHLRREARALGLQNIDAMQVDVLQSSLPETDAVVCRWLLMFLRDPEYVIRMAWRSLRPRGVLAVMDYNPFNDIALTPQDEAFDRVYTAVATLIASFGGDPNVGGRVPEMMRAAGFIDVESQSISRTDIPGSALWEWIVRTGENHVNLVEHGLLSADELAEYHEAMKRAEATEGLTFTSPTVQAIVGRKP